MDLAPPRRERHWGKCEVSLEREEPGTDHPGPKAMAKIWDFILRTLEKHANDMIHCKALLLTFFQSLALYEELPRDP